MANSTTGSRGDTYDISHVLVHYWLKPVLYLHRKAKFPQTKEKKPGYFVGFGHNVGDYLTFEILEEDMRTVLHSNVVRYMNVFNDFSYDSI